MFFTESSVILASLSLKLFQEIIEEQQTCEHRCTYNLGINSRLPREMVRFLGTVRFASRNCHRSREQCRRDDLESWVYMLLEFTEYACLPWSRIVDRDLVYKEKERLFAGSCSFFGSVNLRCSRIFVIDVEALLSRERTTES